MNSPTIRSLYEIHGLIGAGGFGCVYSVLFLDGEWLLPSGTRKDDKLEVALKEVTKCNVDEWGAIADVEVPIEFELLHKASGHPGVVRMLNWHAVADSYILVMERTRAVDLFEYVTYRGPMTEDTARHVFRQIARAVVHCHSKGVVHRDIKDENVLYNAKTSDAKLIDFGCGARLTNIPFREISGAEIYYPPEWFADGRYDGRNVDAWSLGVMLYRIVEGTKPFQSTEEILIGKIRHETRGAKISDSCKHLISRLLNIDPRKRYSVNDALRHRWCRRRAVDRPSCS